MATLTDQDLQQHLDDARTHRADINTLEDRKKIIDKAIIDHLFESEDKFMIVEDGEVKYRLVEEGQGTWAIGQKETKTLDRAMLVAKGVDPALLEECTRTSYSEPFLTFYPKRKKAEVAAGIEVKKGRAKKS